MDGELEASAAASLIGKMRQDPALRQDWALYHLAGDNMRQAGFYSPGLAARVGERLAGESTVLAPGRSAVSERVMRFTLSAAAAVAAVAVVAWGGPVSGNAIGFVQGASLALAYGWQEFYHDDGSYRRALTAQRADLSIDPLLSTQAMYNLINSKIALNAIFEGYISGTTQTARWTMYSGIVDSVSFNQSDGDLFNSTLTYHANIWSATGG